MKIRIALLISFISLIFATSWRINLWEITHAESEAVDCDRTNIVCIEDDIAADTIWTADNRVVPE